jgi:DNA-directed RNA polymerase specialized sigma24 family protein
MRCSISQDDLRTILHEADVAARRLLWQLRLSRDDLEDIRQDLLADVIARLRGFDPDRGSFGAFAGAVMSHRATRIANKIKRERRLFGAVPISLDETIPDTDGLTRGDLVSEEESLSHHLGQQVDVFAAAEHRIDVERGLGLLDQDDRALCAALSHTTVDRLAASGRGGRSSLYRRVRDIRFALTAFGIQAA